MATPAGQPFPQQRRRHVYPHHDRQPRERCSHRRGGFLQRPLVRRGQQRIPRPVRVERRRRRHRANGEFLLPEPHQLQPLAAGAPPRTTSNPQGIGAKVRALARLNGRLQWQRRDITAGDAFNGNTSTPTSAWRGPRRNHAPYRVAFGHGAGTDEHCVRSDPRSHRNLASPSWRSSTSTRPRWMVPCRLTREPAMSLSSPKTWHPGPSWPRSRPTPPARPLGRTPRARWPRTDTTRQAAARLDLACV